MSRRFSLSVISAQTPSRSSDRALANPKAGPLAVRRRRLVPDGHHIHGRVPSFGFSATAAITVSVLIIVIELADAMKALICSSTLPGSASMKILIFSGCGIWLRLKSRDAAAQIVFVRSLDFRGDNFADAQRPPARQINRTVDLGRIGF